MTTEQHLQNRVWTVEAIRFTDPGPELCGDQRTEVVLRDAMTFDHVEIVSDLRYLPTKIGAKVRLRLDLIVDDLEEAAGSMETTPIHKAEAVLPRTHRPES